MHKRSIHCQNIIWCQIWASTYFFIVNQIKADCRDRKLWLSSEFLAYWSIPFYDSKKIKSIPLTSSFNQRKHLIPSYTLQGSWDAEVNKDSLTLIQISSEMAKLPTNSCLVGYVNQLGGLGLISNSQLAALLAVSTNNMNKISFQIRTKVYRRIKKVSSVGAASICTYMLLCQFGT